MEPTCETTDAAEEDATLRLVNRKGLTTTAGLTVGEIKGMLADLPDDMGVAVAPPDTAASVWLSGFGELTKEDCPEFGPLLVFLLSDGDGADEDEAAPADQSASEPTASVS